MAGSTAVLFIKESQIDASLLAALRLLLAAVLLTPVYVRDWRRHRESVSWRTAADAVLPGVALALHLATWNIGARLALGANGTLIVNLVPLIMPVLLAWLASERVNRAEVLGTCFAAASITLMLATSFDTNASHFRGELVCLGSMGLLSVYLTLGRRHRKQPTVWLYMTPLFYTAGVTALLVAVLSGGDLSVDWQTEWRWVAALVCVPTLLGHTLINNAMRYFRGQLVGLTMMGQFIFAGVITYVFLDETPAWSFYVSAVLAMTGAAIAFYSHHADVGKAADEDPSPAIPPGAN